MTIAKKVLKGLDSQGWEIIGRGGTWAAAMRPLEAYIHQKVARAVKAEREACAKVCERFWSAASLESDRTATAIAAAIRKRGEVKL